MDAVLEREYGNELALVSLRKRVATRLRSEPLVLDPTLQMSSPQVTTAVQSVRIEHQEERYLLVGCGNGTLCIFDTLLSECVCSVSRDVEGGTQHHTKGVCVADWYAVDNGLFVVGAFDGTVGVWDTNEMQCARLYRVSDCVNVIAAGVRHDSAHLIAVGTKSDQLRLLDVRQEANTHTLMGHREQVISLAWSPDGSYTLVSGDTEGSVYVWDLRKPVPVHELGCTAPPRTVAPMSRSSSGSGKRLKRSADFHERQVDRIVEQSKGVLMRSGEAPAHAGAVAALKFAPRGNYLVSFAFGDKVKLWDAQNYSLIRSTDCDRKLARIRGMHDFVRVDIAAADDAYDTDPKIVMCANSRVFSISLETLAYQDCFAGMGSGTGSMDYNPGNDRFYSGAQDSVLRVWSYREAPDQSLRALLSDRLATEDVRGVVAVEDVASAEEDEWSI